MKYDVCIVGGCGHVGLPLGITLANGGKRVILYDIDQKSVALVNAGKMPFKEDGADELIKKVVATKTLKATTNKEVIGNSEVIIMTVDTPLDEHLSPSLHRFIKVINEIENQLEDGQLLIMRSTLYPGVTKWIHSYLIERGKKVLVAFCPERIIEGHALCELHELPQIVAGCTPEAVNRATEFFKNLTEKIIVTELIDAELAKLMTNTWRYINFAISNQFYMIANKNGVDFYKLYDIMTKDYPRLKSFARAGFAAGPCLLKDTLQLSAFADNNFLLGHAAMMINEGLPGFVVDSLKQKYDLTKMKVGILGMAFKANSDDPRESLSYKLKKKLEFEAKKVLCHDQHIKNPSFVTIDEIHKNADIIILAAPHDEYKTEDWGDKVLVDVWDYYPKKK
jgi:UDP-N-acetyl-D-mannosaminuronic acid dehydrogenase